MLVGGRTLQMRAPNETQAALLHRNGVIVEMTGKKIDTTGSVDPDVASRGWQSVGKLIDIIVSLFPDADEQEWLGDQLLAGKVELQELVGCLEKVAEGGTVKKPAKKAARAS